MWGHDGVMPSSDGRIQAFWGQGVSLQSIGVPGSLHDEPLAIGLYDLL